MPLLGPSGALPLHSSAVLEKKQLQRSNNAGWLQPVLVPIPGVSTRRLRVLVPTIRLRRQRGPLLVCFACLAVVFTVIVVSRNGFSRNEWEPSPEEPSTLVFRREDLQRIWNWEIASGHFPSGHSIPKQIGLLDSPRNPALPPKSRSIPPSRYRPPSSVLVSADTDTVGVGPKRIYLDIQSAPPNVSYPPRPVPGCIADLDVVMKHCDFSQGKYVRDCLEVLRVGAGLDNGQRTRRGAIDDWKYIYLEEANSSAPNPTAAQEDPLQPPIYRPGVPKPGERETDPDAELVRKRGAQWEAAVSLPPTLTHRPAATLPDPCDPENPRVFHMFWTGPFTDKPYLALLSFLFTQNTGLHEPHSAPAPTTVCRPQFWMWINPGPAAAIPNPNAMHDMFAQLKQSPWASPFLHPRFHDVIHFRLWNTTEQLDGIPEIRDEWRELQKTLFNSGGHVISVPDEEEAETESNDAEAGEPHTTKKEEDMLHRTGSKSSTEYDRLSVILSDMARFVLCHRFGGVYLDADTILLRDWEELWGWKGAFAYRWSRLEKYNTAVLRMNRGSALGTFLFRTALRNGLDFHPMTVSRYTKDAYLEGLLLRLPDALFDGAWLNTEFYQRDRPPQPYFTEFGDFFDTPEQNSAAPQALGFDGFFKGSYSYHFHNFWWKPFDPARNWPDLGPQFLAGEMAARRALREGEGAQVPIVLTTADAAAGEEAGDAAKESVEEDKRDLDWAAVLKRTFESYIRGERANMYGEWLVW
ncbi:glycosyltransferase family 32 protein [Mycena maculata]|uniref:Glycosyltransferase family 32 protein n=1 Tax=Mycena maculata TaxID=230809 RepID=A0AAD7IQB1_9AGAR|nr:glycosyltransferase family 32 protein [Mycena maculata]